MTQQFVSGHLNTVQVTPLGSASIVLGITEHSWEEEINTILVTNSASGGVAARIANVLDGKGTVHADYDVLNPYYIGPAPLIVSGMIGTFLFQLAPVPALRFFQVPGIIRRVPWSSQVMGKVSYQFEVELNSLAGAYLRPSQ